jgi:hypothetical protein
MGKLYFDIEGLKKLAVFNVNLQYFSQKKIANFALVFNYEGELTSEYKVMCEEFEKSINSLVAELEELKQLIVNRGIVSSQESITAPFPPEVR